MRRRFARIFAGPLLAGLALLAIPGAAHAAPCLVPSFPCLSIEPSPKEVTAGSTFEIGVVVRDVSDLFAYDVEVSYDPSILGVVSITDGTALSPSNPIDFLSFFDNNLGEAFASDTMERPNPGVTIGPLGGLLFIIKFQALAAGSTTIEFDTVCGDPPGDTLCTQLLDSNNPSLLIPYLTAVGYVKIADAPEPGLMALLAVGLLAAARRRASRR
jgi:general secretion pathway protein D